MQSHPAGLRVNRLFQHLRPSGFRFFTSMQRSLKTGVNLTTGLSVKQLDILKCNFCSLVYLLSIYLVGIRGHILLEWLKNWSLQQFSSHISLSIPCPQQKEKKRKENTMIKNWWNLPDITWNFQNIHFAVGHWEISNDFSPKRHSVS